MRVVILTTDNRENDRSYQDETPRFGAAPEALLQGMAEISGLEVHVVACTQRPVFSPQKINNKILFHSVVVPKLGWMRTLYQGCVRQIRKLVREIDPDIVHGQGTERENALGAVFSGFPNVVTLHGIMSEQARLFHARVGSFHWLAARLENFALPRTDGVFCNSAYTENSIRPRAKRTWRVANPLRKEFFEMAAANESGRKRPRLLCIGNVIPRKRQLQLLDTALALRSRGVDLEWHFIGRAPPDDPYAAAFLSKVKSLTREDFVRHFDEMPGRELIRCLDAADALVHFPSEEAFGLVVAEALARGLRLFAAQLGGIVDISQGVPGVQLVPGDDWPALAQALAGWVNQGYPRCPAAAAHMRERYHPELIARRHQEIYREVLSSDS